MLNVILINILLVFYFFRLRFFSCLLLEFSIAKFYFFHLYFLGVTDDVRRT
jgi:hypothetical protein